MSGRIEDESDTLAGVGRKVCTVKGLDSRGLPVSVHVEAESLFEAAAAGLEEIHNGGGLITEVHVTIHAPVQQFKVHPRQLEKWLLSYGREDNVGTRALKG